MDKNKIIELLGIIEFDSSKHDSIKAAIKEVLDSDIYAPIMKGIVTDEKLLSEVRKIIDAYNELKEIDNELLDEVINELSNNFDEKNIDDINEFYDDDCIKQIIIDDSDSNEAVLKVKNEDSTFTEILRVPSDQFESHSYTYSVKGLGTFNLLGKKLSDLDTCEAVTDNIYKFSSDEETNYIFLDGRKIVIDDSNKNLEKLFDYYSLSEETKNKIFDNYLDGKLGYLSYEIKHITNKYVYCSLDDEIAWFSLTGDKILSTNDGFPFIYDLSNDLPEDGKNIVIVGEYDSKFDQLYSYYDLDNRTFIQSPKFLKAYPWASYVVTAIEQDNSINMYKIVDNRLEKVRECFYVDGFISGYVQLLPYSVIKLNDDLYLLDVMDEYGSFRDKGYLIVKDLLTNPEIVIKKNNRVDDTSFKKFVKFDFLNGVYGYTKDGELKNIEIKDDKIEAKDLTIEHIINNYNYDKELADDTLMIDDNGSNLGILENSGFLLPVYKKNELSIINKKELVAEVEKYSLSKIPNEKKTLVSNDKDNESYDFNDMYAINDFVYFDNDNKKYKYEKVINPKTGKVFSSNKNIEILYTLSDGHMIVEAVYGNGKKKFVLDDELNIVLGPVDNITIPHYKNIMIITNKKKQQLYQNYLPISYQADKIDCLIKYYVNKNGIVLNTECIFKIQNNNSKFIVDEDGDNILEQSEQLKDLINMVNNVDNELLDTKVKQKKINRGN